MKFLVEMTFIDQMKDDRAEFLGRKVVHKPDEGH